MTREARTGGRWGRRRRRRGWGRHWCELEDGQRKTEVTDEGRNRPLILCERERGNELGTLGAASVLTEYIWVTSPCEGAVYNRRRAPGSGDRALEHVPSRLRGETRSVLLTNSNNLCVTTHQIPVHHPCLVNVRAEPA